MKKQIELLSPVGDFECLKAAVQNGADSVYFGAEQFSARASASNFDFENLEKAINYAKVRNVKTHLTLNTLIKDEELEDAILLAKKAYEFGIDAIIVQDIGLSHILLKEFPDLPLHASTQMTIHNLEGVKKLEEAGFKRAVLSRELSLSDIQYICDRTNMEIEVFIHGALCISYSGQCLFSSMIGGRSGNRGKCAQPCRLPYKLYEEDNKNSTQKIDQGYLLSTRDLCGLPYIPDLIKMGVSCFKIEGRMKNPEYVATVTRIYRKYIDMALAPKQEYKIEEKDKKELMLCFNRGGFSDGHLTDKPNKQLVYPEKPNNMGLPLGTISNYNPNKGLITLTLSEEIAIGDTIMVQHENTKYMVSELMQKHRNLINGIPNQTVQIGRVKGNIKIGDSVYKLASKELSKEVKATMQKENKKIPLNCEVTIQKNMPISITIYPTKSRPELYKNLEVHIDSNVTPVDSIKHPITKERILQQLSKTTDTPYTFETIQVNLGDNLYIPTIRTLNELRRDGLAEVEKIIQNRIKRISKLDTKTIQQAIKPTTHHKSIAHQNNLNISLLFEILRPGQDYSKLEGINRIYIPLKYFASSKYDSAIEALSNKFDLYIYMPTIILANYINLFINCIDNALSRYNIKGFVLSNLAGNKVMQMYQGKGYHFIGNYTLNVYNKITAETLKNLGLDEITISPELSKEHIQSILEDIPYSELMVYGKIPIMSTNYCYLGKTNHCYPTCQIKCQNDKKYYLIDRLGMKFRILPDNVQTITKIFNSKITSIPFDDLNPSSVRIDSLDETIEELNYIIQIIKSKKRLEGPDYTNGNFRREV